jgi:hypothetical protein
LDFEPDENDYTGEEIPDEALYNEQEWRKMQSPLLTTDSAYKINSRSPRVRNRALRQRVVGKEIKTGRRLTEEEIADLAEQIKFAPVFICFVDEVSNGNLPKLPEDTQMGLLGLLGCENG